MRRYADVKDMQTMKSAIINGWPSTYRGHKIKYSDIVGFLFGETFEKWRFCNDVSEFQLLPPERDIHFAKALLEQTGVWAQYKGKIINVRKILDNFLITNVGTLLPEQVKFYLFNPDNHVDLLKEVSSNA